MEPVALGNTGLAVSPIGLGLAAIGRPGYLNLGHGDDLAGRRAPDALRSHAATMLDAAVTAGIRYFDVARSYGRGEEFLGSWLASRRSDAAPFTVASKWGYAYTAGWQVEAEVHEIKDHSVATLRRQLTETRSLLGDHLDLYQIHSATVDTGVLDDAAVVAELARLREAGLVVGLSTSGPDQAATIERALHVMADGVALFGSVQATWNLLETSVEPALAAAAEEGLGIIVKEAVANGRLTSRNPALPKALHDLPHSPDAIAIAAVLHRPWSDVVLSGAATLDQLASNLAAIEVPPDVIAALPELAEDPATYWRRRSEMRWT